MNQQISLKDPNNVELLAKNLKQQDLADDAFLDEVMQQISQMSAEQLDSIQLYEGSSNLDSFENGAIYVDKTEQILNAINNRCVLLARPDHMGKSLTLSTVSLMSQEWYQRSIYPEHQLCHVLQNTFFAQEYSNGTTWLRIILGTPYDVFLSFKDIGVNPVLVDQVEAKTLAYDQQLINQKLSDSLASKQICELLIQECSNNPNLQRASDFYWDHKESLSRLLSNDKILLLIIELDQKHKNVDCPLIDTVKAKVADIEDELQLFREQLNALAVQIEELSKKQTATDTSGFVDQSFEGLGQFRKNILINLCSQLSCAVRENDRIISALKNEILTNSPDYQQGLDLIEQQSKRNEDIQKQLAKKLQEIEAAPKWETVGFTGALRSLFYPFNTGDISLLIDDYPDYFG